MPTNGLEKTLWAESDKLGFFINTVTESVVANLMQVLREQRGYTYGIRCGFSGTGFPGPFRISSSVRSNVTLDALEAQKDQLSELGLGEHVILDRHQ